jgi:hypothetical protein
MNAATNACTQPTVFTQVVVPNYFEENPFTYNSPGFAGIELSPESAWTNRSTLRILFPEADVSSKNPGSLGDFARIRVSHIAPSPVFLSSIESDWFFRSFNNWIKKNKEFAIAMLSNELLHGSLIRRSALEFLFSNLIASRVYDESLYFEAITRLFSPDEIYSIASDAYRQYGYDRRLSIAAAMLRAKGRESWAVLENIAASKQPECEFFVDVITTLEGVSFAQRSKAIRNLAKNPDVDVRLSLVYALRDIREIRDPVALDLLANDENEDIKDYVSEMR